MPQSEPRAAQRVIAEARARGVDPSSDHAEVRAALDALPSKVQRRRGWLQASILVDLAHRERPRRVRRQLARMRRREYARGVPERFEAFWQECREVLGGDTLGSHGYRAALGGLDDAAVWRDVAALEAAVQARGLTTFVNSGTLLGIIRDGGLIAHDDDIDLALVVPGCDLDEVSTGWRQLRRELLAEGRLDEEFEAKGRVHAKARTSAGVGVDLFPAWVVDGRLWVWPHTPGSLVADRVLPPERRTVAGAEVSVPREPELLLELNYGPDWRVPDPTWSFDWQGAVERFGPAVEALRPASPSDQGGRVARL